jgi:hypothetical protein
MNSPENLQYFMETIFYHLYEIDKLYSDNNIRKVDKDIKTASIWFSLNTKLNNYLENVLLPDLQYGFKLHKDALTKKQEDKMKQNTTDREQFDRYIQTADINTPVATTGEYEQYQKSLEQIKFTDIHITPVNEENHQN